VELVVLVEVSLDVDAGTELLVDEAETEAVSLFAGVSDFAGASDEDLRLSFL
jgi:hypothetical protein